MVRRREDAFASSWVAPQENLTLVLAVIYLLWDRSFFIASFPQAKAKEVHEK